MTLLDPGGRSDARLDRPQHLGDSVHVLAADPAVVECGIELRNLLSRRGSVDQPPGLTQRQVAGLGQRIFGERCETSDSLREPNLLRLHPPQQPASAIGRCVQLVT